MSHMKAIDADEGKNSEVVYSLVSTSPDGLLEYFRYAGFLFSIYFFVSQFSFCKA